MASKKGNPTVSFSGAGHKTGTDSGKVLCRDVNHNGDYLGSSDKLFCFDYASQILQQVISNSRYPRARKKEEWRRELQMETATPIRRKPAFSRVITHSLLFVSDSFSFLLVLSAKRSRGTQAVLREAERSLNGDQGWRVYASVI